MGLAIGQIVAGLIESFFGRRLYWFFVALGGFAIGWEFATAISSGMSEWVAVLIGAVLGIGLAFLSLKFAKWVVTLAAFFALGTATVDVVRWLGGEATQGTSSYWIAYIIGGLIGAALIRIFFDWGLMVLTALVGAGAVATGITHFVSGEPKWLQVVLFVVILVLGLSYQIRSFRGKKPAPAS
jgi:MFS family permease